MAPREGVRLSEERHEVLRDWHRNVQAVAWSSLVVSLLALVIAVYAALELVNRPAPASTAEIELRLERLESGERP